MKTTLKLSLLLALLAALLLVVTVSAQTGGGYDLTWSTIDGGGQTFSTGGDFALGGTIGQADAGALQGGEFTLAGGFWTDTTVFYQVLLPLVLKN